MPETENQKQLRIKLSSVKRIEKETASYVKEANKQKEKIAKLEAENGEQAYINKQKQVLQETESMIPDCQSRYDTALEDLDLFIEDFAEDEDLKDTEKLKEAQEYLQAKKV
jgi:tubulin-specific chaperone A|eukprot:g5125.t1